MPTYFELEQHRAQQAALERQKFLAKPDDLANLVADKMEAFLPSVAKPSTKYATRLEAIEKETPSDHPLVGVPREVYERTYAALQDPRQMHKSPYQLLNEATMDRLLQPDVATPTRSLLERTYEYKRDKDTGFLGTGLFSGNVKSPLGYSSWLQGKRTEEEARPSEDWLASWGDIATSMAAGAALGGAFGLATGGPAVAGPSALTAAAAMVPMEVIGHPIRRLLHGTEWYRSKEESPSLLDKAKLIAADLAPDMAVGFAAPGISRRLAVKAGEMGLAEATGTMARLGTGGQTLPEAVGSIFPAQERVKLGIIDPVARLGVSTGIGDVMPLYGGLVAKGAIKKAYAPATELLAKSEAADRLLSDAAAALERAPTADNILEAGKATQLARIARLRAETVIDSNVGREEVFDLVSAFERHVDARAAAAGINDPRIAGIAKPFSEWPRPKPPGEPPAGGGITPPPTPGGPGPGMPPPQVFRGAPARERTIVDALDQIKAAQAKAFGARATTEIEGKVAFSKLDDEAANHALSMSESGVPIADASRTVLGMQQDINQSRLYDSVYKTDFGRSLEKRQAVLDSVDTRLAAKQSLRKQGSEARNKYSGEITSTVPATAKPVDVGAAIQAAHEGRVGSLGAQGLGLTPQESRGAVRDLNTFYDSLNAQAVTEQEAIRPTLETIARKSERYGPKPQSGGDIIETPGPLGVDTPGNYAEQAAKHGLQFNGMQERFNKPPIPLFTDTETGATFALNEGESVASAKARKLKDFGLASLIPAALLGAAGVGASLFGPDSAEAGVIDSSMGTVSKAVGGWLRTAAGVSKEVEPLMKAVDKMHLNAVPINPADPYMAPRAMEGLSLAPSAMKDLGGTKEAIARTSKFFLGLDRFMTPYTVGEIFYKPGYNPAVELASRQEAWMKNTTIRGQVAANILDAVPGYRATQAEGRKAVIEAFEPLAQRHAEDVGMYRALEMREAALGEYLTAMGRIKNPKDKVIGGIERAQGELETVTSQKQTLAPNVADFQAETTSIYDRLSKRYSGVRMSLAAEDTTTFDRYPFLKGRLNYDEQAAVARIKGLMEDYRQRIDNVGLDTITDMPYIHHGWHPAWSEANVAKRLADLDLTLANALPFSKFFRRSQYSMQMVPEVAYNLERYIPDAEKRIQLSQFWDKSNPTGWWRHASSSVVQGSEPLRNFWQLIRDSAVPTGVTPGNQWMNRYAMFESLRLIGWAPSVAFKHLFKQAGTFASLGVRDTLATAPLSGGVAARNYLRKNVSPEMLQSLGLAGGSRDATKVLDEFVDSFVRQNRMQNILQDLDLRPYGNSVPDQVLNKLATNSGVLVGMVESFDRANSVMASMLMAQKAGMTAQQAVYSIYDTVLKNNFLGGVMNASWMKDPWIRGLFLFQSTPFKIAERRLVQAYKTNQSLGKAWDVIPGRGPLEKLQQLAGVKNFVQEGEAQFKRSMLLDALKSEKDTFGTPVAKQFAKEMLIAGLVIGGGGALGLDLKPQVGHFPFLKADSTDPAISVSPVLSSAFRTLGDRGKAEREGEDPQFFVSNFLQNWIGKEGYLPLTASKLLRISQDDIPERYKGSGLQYLFSVPSKKEKLQ